MRRFGGEGEDLDVSQGYGRGLKARVVGGFLFAFTVGAAVWVVWAGGPATAEPEVFAEAMAQGDQAYALRGEENDGKGEASSARIEEAISAYERAYAIAPENLEATWKLMAALFFAGDFAASNDAQAQAWFARGKTVSEQALPRLQTRLGLEKPLASMEAEAIRRAVPEALRRDVAALYFWSAINWGAWSRYEGLLSVVRSGVAGKLRNDSKVSLALDPTIYRGGAQRLLAHLHATLPRVPFISGWVKRADAVVYADAALEILPTDIGNQTILGLVLVETVANRRDEGIGILEAVLEREPRADLIVEDQATQELARETLAKVRRS